MIAKTPALVVQPAGDGRRRRRRRRSPASTASRSSVRGGGHNIAGTALADGGVTIDMSRLREVDVDPDARTATVEPGCLLGDVDRATQRHGLATPLGFISEVGVAGLTLGGGLGYLTRRFGWTVDNLLEVEIVTADGRVRRAEPRRASRPVLGGPRRGREPRRRHLVHVRPARGRPDRLRRADRLAVRAGGRGPRRLPRRSPPRRRASWRSWLMMLRAPAAPFVPPRVARRADLRDGRLLQRRPGRRRRGAGADPGARRPGRRPARRAAVHASCSPTSTRPSRRACTTTGGPSTLAELSDELLETMRELFAELPDPRRRDRPPAPRRRAQRARRPTTARSATATPATRWASIGMWEPGEPGRRGVPRAGCATAWDAAPAVLDRRHLRQLPDRRRGRRRASARPTARTSTASPRSSGRTIRTTCSARTATFRPRRLRVEREHRFPVPVRDGLRLHHRPGELAASTGRASSASSRARAGASPAT